MVPPLPPALHCSWCDSSEAETSEPIGTAERNETGNFREAHRPDCARPHLHQDWAHPSHICPNTVLLLEHDWLSVQARHRAARARLQRQLRLHRLRRACVAVHRRPPHRGGSLRGNKTRKPNERCDVRTFLGDCACQVLFGIAYGVGVAALTVMTLARARTHSHSRVCRRTRTHPRTHTHARATTRTHAHALAPTRMHAHACTSTTHARARTRTHSWIARMDRTHGSHLLARAHARRHSRADALAGDEACSPCQPLRHGSACSHLIARHGGGADRDRARSSTLRSLPVAEPARRQHATRSATRGVKGAT